MAVGEMIEGGGLADAVTKLCKMGKAEAVAVLKAHGSLPPREFVIALWSALPVRCGRGARPARGLVRFRDPHLLATAPRARALALAQGRD